MRLGPHVSDTCCALPGTSSRSLTSAAERLRDLPQSSAVRLSLHTGAAEWLPRLLAGQTHHRQSTHLSAAVSWGSDLAAARAVFCRLCVRCCGSARALAEGSLQGSRRRAPLCLCPAPQLDVFAGSRPVCIFPCNMLICTADVQCSPGLLVQSPAAGPRQHAQLAGPARQHVDRMLAHGCVGCR